MFETGKVHEDPNLSRGLGFRTEESSPNDVPLFKSLGLTYGYTLENDGLWKRHLRLRTLETHIG